MDAMNIWQLFVDTGAPELYMLYIKARKAEESNVSYNPGTCVESHPLQ